MCLHYVLQSGIFLPLLLVLPFPLALELSYLSFSSAGLLFLLGIHESDASALLCAVIFSGRTGCSNCRTNRTTKISSFQETKQSGTQDFTMTAPANFAGCFLCPHQDPILSSRQDLVNHLETWHKMQRCPFPS